MKIKLSRGGSHKVVKYVDDIQFKKSVTTYFSLSPEEADTFELFTPDGFQTPLESLTDGEHLYVVLPGDKPPRCTLSLLLDWHCPALPPQQSNNNTIQSDEEVKETIPRLESLSLNEGTTLW